MTDLGSAEPWLDLSRYPNLDPDHAVEPAHLDALRAAVNVPQVTFPDDLWHHLLAGDWTRPDNDITDHEPTDSADTHGEEPTMSYDTTPSDDTSYDDEDDKTWGESEYTEDDVIEAADHTGYTSYSDYIAGDNGLDPDF